MPFDYYERLTARQKATYRKSASVASIALPDVAACAPHLKNIEDGLAKDDRRLVSRGVGGLVAEILRQVAVPPVKVEVLARRPSSDTAELHGLYVREEGETPVLQVWMRTAAHENPVAFRTFVRTVLHEVLHHLDFEHLALEDTFHTEGFFQRESSFVRQLLGKSTNVRSSSRADGQLDLFGKPKR